jgi:molecular chaperone GrpE
MMSENDLYYSREDEEEELKHTLGKEGHSEDNNKEETGESSREEEHSPELEVEGISPESGEEAEAVKVEELQHRVAELEQEKEELKNRLLRLQADFENFRRRVRLEKEELISYGNFDLLQKLLPVIDNLERALAASHKGSEGSEGIVEGLEMIKKHFLDILFKEGVVPIESVGKPFDPNCHEAVFTEVRSDYPPGTVVEELQKGYMFNERVLRASMVKVSTE